MANKKILTLEQLANFCETSQFHSFDSKKMGYTICVQVPGLFEIKEDLNQGLLFAKLKVCHTLLNRNGSYISEENMKKAMPSLKYRPVLGYIHQLDSGEYDFHSHDMEITTDENGNEVIIYKESQIGAFTADEPYLEYDESEGKTYVIATGAIPEEYTKAADIIRRKNGTKVSCELWINEFSYNAKEKYIEIEDFLFYGCTCLGCEKDGTEIGEGMLGSRLDIIDFSTANNSICTNVDTNSVIIEKLEMISNKLDSFSNLAINQNTEKGGSSVNKFEELLEKYGLSVEDITFEYEGVDDEELEKRFEEFVNASPAAQEGSTVTDGVVVSEPTVTSQNALVVPQKYSIGLSDGTVMDFELELSLDEIYSTLYNLVNQAYSEADNTYYSVSVYETYVIMTDWWNNRAYKQNYTREDDNFVLTGDRVEVYACWLTSDEEASLKEMRSNYAELKAYKEQKESEIERGRKLDLLKDYTSISQTQEYSELIEKIDQYSDDEVVEKADAIVGKYARQGMNFDFNNANTQLASASKKAIKIVTKEIKNPVSYSGLFDEK